MDFQVVSGTSISASTIPPMNPDGVCVEDMQTGDCVEQEACKPDTQTVTFTAVSGNRQQARMTPLNGPANPVSLHFGGTNPDGSPGDTTLAVDLKDRFTPEQLEAACGQVAFLLEQFEKVQTEGGEELVRVASATIGCTPCAGGAPGE